MRIFPGNHPSTSIATSAVAHICGAWPGPLMEGPFAVGRCGSLARDIVTNPIGAEDGEIAVPTAPGLGLELDMDRIAALRADV
jgi:muconate cycloisomerase